jgi:hypothetical protein
VPVHFSVDATQLGTGSGPLGAGCGSRYDVISWYFPHSGATPNHAPHAVDSNRRLIKGFLAAAPRLLKPLGTVELAVKRGTPYDQWRVKELLPEEAGFSLLEVCALDHSSFPG